MGIRWWISIGECVPPASDWGRPGRWEFHAFYWLTCVYARTLGDTPRPLVSSDSLANLVWVSLSLHGISISHGRLRGCACGGPPQADLGRSLVGRQGLNIVPACVDKAALSACRIGKVTVAVYNNSEVNNRDIEGYNARYIGRQAILTKAGSIY